MGARRPWRRSQQPGPSRPKLPTIPEDAVYAPCAESRAVRCRSDLAGQGARKRRQEMAERCSLTSASWVVEEFGVTPAEPALVEYRLVPEGLVLRAFKFEAEIQVRRRRFGVCLWDEITGRELWSQDLERDRPLALGGNRGKLWAVTVGPDGKELQAMAWRHPLRQTAAPAFVKVIMGESIKLDSRIQMKKWTTWAFYCLTVGGKLHKLDMTTLRPEEPITLNPHQHSWIREGVRISKFSSNTF